MRENKLADKAKLQSKILSRSTYKKILHLSVLHPKIA